jgi:hypothetical protein
MNDSISITRIREKEAVKCFIINCNSSAPPSTTTTKFSLFNLPLHSSYSAASHTPPSIIAKITECVEVL